MATRENGFRAPYEFDREVSMAIGEESRHHLYQRLEEVLGRGDATVLIEHLPPGRLGRCDRTGPLAPHAPGLRCEDHAGRRWA